MKLALSECESREKQKVSSKYDSDFGTGIT